MSAHDSDLRGIRCDFWDVLLRAPNEIAGLRAALIEGRIDGSNYLGDCACLIGKIANLRELLECDDLGNGLKPNANRPIERWFNDIQLGDTPKTNAHSQLAVQWLDEFVELLAHAVQQSGRDVPPVAHRQSHLDRIMSTAPAVPLRVTREMIEAHYKSIMNAARRLLSQGETIHAQDLLSEACSRPYPSPAPAQRETPVWSTEEVELLVAYFRNATGGTR